MRRKIAFWLFLSAGFYLIVLLARDLWQVMGVKNRMVGAEEEVKALEEDQVKLLDEWELVQSDDFIEKEARDKLMLGKPGEVVVVVPEVEKVEVDLPDGEARDSVRDGDLTGKGDQEEVGLKNWEKWVKLFF